MNKTFPSDDRQARPERSRLGRNHTAALITRILPLLMLVAGMLWLTETMRPAMAQQTNQSQTSSNETNLSGFNSSQATAADQNDALGGAIPSLPTTPNTQDPAGPKNPSNIEQTPPKASLISKISEGGILMIPLALCSLVVAAIFIEKVVSLRRGRVIPRPFVRRFTEFVEDGQLSYEEATKLCEEFDCPVAEVFKAAIRRWGRPMLEIEQAVMDAGDRVADSLKRFVKVFHAISNVAPLIGLLGTVLGMIESFETISDQESLGRPEMLASGISTALMTTAGGLMVAIPAYLAYMYFSSKSDRYLTEIDRLCQRVVDCISAESLDKTVNKKGSSKRSKAA
ncbi:MotA/TolQ/ExbB proton channel family protein [bacterium]|nr:MotA/TolQ/ExbB proton channel family protein [bacterium]